MSKKEYIEKLASILLSAGADFLALAQEDLEALTDEQLADRNEQIMGEMERKLHEMLPEGIA